MSFHLAIKNIKLCESSSLLSVINRNKVPHDFTWLKLLSSFSQIWQRCFSEKSKSNQPSRLKLTVEIMFIVHKVTYMFLIVLMNEIPFFLGQRSVPDRQPINREFSVWPDTIHIFAQHDVPISLRGDQVINTDFLFCLRYIVNVQFDSNVNPVDCLSNQTSL